MSDPTDKASAKKQLSPLGSRVDDEWTNVSHWQDVDPASTLNRAQIEELVREHGLSPRTRRIIIGSLTFIITIVIVAEVIFALSGSTGSSDALITIAATAAGALAAMATAGMRR